MKRWGGCQVHTPNKGGKLLVTQLECFNRAPWLLCLRRWRAANYASGYDRTCTARFPLRPSWRSVLPSLALVLTVGTTFHWGAPALISTVVVVLGASFLLLFFFFFFFGLVCIARSFGCSVSNGTRFRWSTVLQFILPPERSGLCRVIAKK